MIAGDTTGYETGNDVFAWFDASIETIFGCKMQNPDDAKRFLYNGRPNYSVTSKKIDGEKKFWLKMRNKKLKVNGVKVNTIDGKDIVWECPSGRAAYDAQSVSTAL